MVKRFFGILVATVLTGCGGGGGGGSSSSVSLVPSAPPGPTGGGSSSSGSSTINEGELAENSLRVYSSQFSAASAPVPGSQREEVYDPQTQSSVARAFAQATLTAATTSRKDSAFLIASSTYGIAPAARDLIAAIGVAEDGYTFLDTGSEDVSNRSAYLSTPENSLVNILSNPLYTKRGSRLVGGLIISPDDINSHGWIVSDTGFDGNIDPLAGITGRGWLRRHKADIEHGYSQAVATGKVRLFYGLSADGASRHSSSNGCKGFEQYCLGTPYSLRVKNGQGGYTDVEGAFVSTYGFAAYVMAWERMPADTPISKVFELGDACAHDLGEQGADADTGLGRLDVGCMAGRIYQASVVVEEDASDEEEDIPTVVPPVTVMVDPTPTVTVAVEVKPTVSATISVPEDKEDLSVTVVVDPTPTVTVAVKPTVSITISVPEEKEDLPVTEEDANEEEEDVPQVVPPITADPGKVSLSPVTILIKRTSGHWPHTANVIAHKTGDPSRYWIHSHGRELFPDTPSGNSIYIQLKDDYYGRIADFESTRKAILQGTRSSYSGALVPYTVFDSEIGSLPASGWNYEAIYQTTYKNGLAHFLINPVFLDERGKRAMPYGYDIWIDPGYVKNWGWIVTGTGYDWLKHNPSVESPFLHGENSS